MSTSGLELDFFRLEKESTTKKLLERRRSFRDIQNVVSKIRPAVLKSVIARSSTPKEEQNCFPAFPVYVPTSRPSSGGDQKGVDTAPLTIFYNGTVAVFDIPRDKAEIIMKRAEGAAESKLAYPVTDRRQLLARLDGDLPIARRKSLERFLEKRKERLTLASPYAGPSPTSSASAGQEA